MAGLLRAARAEPAAESVIDCQLLYEIPDGVYVDAGSDSGLSAGQSGWLRRNGQPVVRVEVVSVSSGSAYLRFLTPRPKDLPGPGERVALAVLRDEATPEKPRAPSRTLRDRAGDEPAAVSLEKGAVQGPTIDDGSLPGGRAAKEAENESAAAQSDPPRPPRPLLPLLSPEGDGTAFTEAFNIFKGQTTLRQLFQVTPGDRLDYFVTHWRSSGSVERIEATPWAFEWSADLSYRDGDALENVDDFRELRLELYRMAFYRRFDDQSTVRFGRFLPRELPSIGYVDGAQGEYVWNQHLRFGSVAGLKPRREGLDFSVHESIFATYVTLDVAERFNAASYTGTLGLLTSVYKGKFDRLALLGEQTLRIEELRILSSSEIDFDVGAAEVNEGLRLTRWDLVASYPIFPHTTLRAGLDRYERPDNAAERDAVDDFILEDVEFFDRGYWRYWLGASHQLPLRFTLSEEVSLTDASQEDWSFRWNLSLTKTGLPFLPSDSSLTLTLFNLQGEDLDGYGGRFSGHLPWPGTRLFFQPDLAFRFIRADTEDERFTFTDTSLRALWMINSAWTVSGGVAYGFTEDIQRYLVDFAVTFRW